MNDQQSKLPTSKVAAAGVAVAPGVAVAMILQWALSLVGVDMPDVIMLAVAAVIPVAAAYFKTERHAERGRHAKQ